MIARSSTHTHTHTHTIGTVKRKGFTIIQLVIGMLIFAILTGIAFFGISIYTAQANETRVASDLGTFEVAIKDYMLNNPGACSDGTLNPVGLNHYLTKENTLALDEADPNKDDLGTEISVAAGVKSEAAYKKLSVLEDPWGHQYRVVIRNNADRTAEDGEYGAKGTDRAFIYVYSMGKDGKGAANDTKQDDSVLCVQYSDGEVYSRSYLPSDGKNQAIAAPAYTYWNKDENGKHSVMKDSIFAVGAVDPSKAPGKENGSSGGSGAGGGDESGSDSDESTTRNGKIPAGATYTVEASGEVLRGDNGDSFPRLPLSGDTYEEGDYVYRSAWSEANNLKRYIWEADVKDRSKAEYGTILSEIAGNPVASLFGTFSRCEKLTKAPKIPDSVNSMYETFFSCSALEAAPVIPSSVKAMYRAFSYCTSLTSAPNIPGNVADMSNAFEGCTSLTTAPTIQSGVENMSNAFEGCASLESAPTMPDSVVNMSETFSGCKSLTVAPAIPSSVADMSKAFYDCTALTTAPAIPGSVANMSGAFQSCTSLTTAPAVSSGVTDMHDAFASCVSLKTYTGSKDTDGDFSNYVIPNSVVDMERTFSFCTAITSAPKLPSSVTNVRSTFNGCDRLSTAPAIPEGITDVRGIFADCGSLKTYVGSKDRNGDFSNYKIPSSVTSVATMFKGTPITIAPTIPDGVTNMMGTFLSCWRLTTAPVIPSGVTNMKGTFRGCAELWTYAGSKDNNEDSDEYGNFSNYTIPDGVTDMSLAFAGCKWITRAPVIPHSVENVKAAFSNCTSLTGAVTVNANPATYDDCFKGTAKPITLHGTSTLLNELAKTAKGGNVAVG